MYFRWAALCIQHGFLYLILTRPKFAVCVNHTGGHTFPEVTPFQRYTLIKVTPAVDLPPVSKTPAVLSTVRCKKKWRVWSAWQTLSCCLHLKLNIFPIYHKCRWHGGGGGGGMGGKAKSYHSEKAWSSTDHSILSVWHIKEREIS
jgi:hypothetical protein